MATTKISQITTSNRGFTLIEVLIVLGMLSAIAVIVLPRMRAQQTNIRQVTREMASLGREIRNQSRLKNMTHRLVIEMNADDHAYWVENAAGPVLVKTEEQKKQEADLSEEDRPKDPFQRAEKLTKKNKKLPSGLFFGSVETTSQIEPLTKGTAYIYFSPEGLVEKSAIQITDRKNLTWTLIFNPLTGQSDIVEKAISLKDFKTE